MNQGSKELFDSFNSSGEWGPSPLLKVFRTFNLFNMHLTAKEALDRVNNYRSQDQDNPRPSLPFWDVNLITFRREVDRWTQDEADCEGSSRRPESDHAAGS